MSTKLIWTPPAGSAGNTVTLDADPSAQIKLRGLPSIGDAVDAKPYVSKAAGQSGETPLDVTLPPRTVQASAVLQAASALDLWDLRAEIARSFALQPVRFGESLVLGLLTLQRDGYDDREIDALPMSVDTQRMRAAGMGTFDAEWYCPYPWWRDTADTVLDIDEGATEIAVNAGGVDAPFVAVLHGPCTEVTLTNMATGEAFTITITLGSSDLVTVNTTPGSKSIKKTISGVETTDWSGLDLTTPRLFSLRPGNSSVKFEAVGAGANTAATLTWRNRYGGVK